MNQRNAAATLIDESETPQTEVALAPVASETVLVFERLAKDPSVDVAKLKELIALQEHIIAKSAESQFWSDFAEMQGHLPTINEDGAIVVSGVVRSKYSTNENIQEVIRPILQRFGFALSFRNSRGTDGLYVVKGILAHRGGHKEFDEFESKADDGGSMNSIQRIGSMRSYGQRYTSIALLNIVSRAKTDRDDDGRQFGKGDIPDPPDGYEKWLKGIADAAAKGLKSFEPAWECSDHVLKNYAIKYYRDDVNALKKQAAAVKGQR